MLNFNEFQEYVKENILKFLSKEYQDAEVTLNTVTKNNGIELHALIVKTPDAQIAPSIYLDECFKQYESGVDLDIVMKNIGKIAMDNMDAPKEFLNIAQDIQNFDFVKDKIIMSVINAEKNSDLLANVPHQKKEDLALIYKVMLGQTKNGAASIKINNELLSKWNVTADVIHNLAMENTKRILPITIQTMNEVLGELIPDEMEEELLANMNMNPDMFIITNTSKVNGAVTIFYEDVLEILADKIGTDLYILPSSVHECIVVSADMATPDTLSEMVREVNDSCVSEEEQLSDHVYLYKKETKEFCMA